jgi:hypothetical protein
MASPSNQTQTERLVVYPNPAQNELLISAIVSGVKKTQVFIRNSLGSIVLQSPIDVSFQQAYAKLNISQLPNGLYVVQLGDKVEKLMIVR